MRRDLRQSSLLVIAAIGVGWIGWIGHPLAFAIAVLFPALWANAPDRLTAAAVAAGYFLAASRGLPLGVANFYQTDMGAGLLLWLIAAAGFVLVHTALWTNAGGWRRAVRLLVAMVLMAVPPFGIVGWAHPLTAAGALFPGWGWFGLIATIVLLLGMTTKFAPGFAVAAGLAWAISVASLEPASRPADWAGVDTAVGGSSVVTQFVSPQTQHQLYAAVQRIPPGAIAVLPESAAGLWTPTVENLWTTSLGDRTALVGASIIRPRGYDNAMIALGSDGAKIIYRQRMPVPVSMWRPWNRWLGEPAGASASFFGQPIIEFEGQRLGILICYEQLLIWPVIQSMAHQPDILIATGNGWWTEGTSIIPIQLATMQAWARLFDVPLVTSFNR